MFLVYFPKNFSNRSRTLFQPWLWRSRDSSLGNLTCVNRSSCAAVAIGEFDRYFTRVIFPSLIVVPFPGEDDLLCRDERAVLAEHAHLLALLVDQIPTVLPPNTRVGGKSRWDLVNQEGEE